MIFFMTLTEGTGSSEVPAQFVNALPSRASTARVVVLAADYMGQAAGVYVYRKLPRQWVRAMPLDAVMESMLSPEVVIVYLDIPEAIDVGVYSAVYRNAQLQVGQLIKADPNVWVSRVVLSPQ